MLPVTPSPLGDSDGNTKAELSSRRRRRSDAFASVPHLPAYEAGALTVMLRCLKHRVRIELHEHSSKSRLATLACEAGCINGFARRSGLEGFPHRAIAEGADHRLNLLGYRCKKNISYI